jgi:PRTRC genetic system protein C
MTRTFIYNGTELEDPGAGMTPDAVRKFYASNGFPALNNGSIVGPKKKGDHETYEFKVSAGTKG